MVQITYVEHSGGEHPVDVPVGLSVMEGARRNGISGILADCGGACSCATCHVYVDRSWQAQTGKPGDTEEAMLEFADEPDDRSRLSCQIEVTEELDGLVVHLPARQAI